MSKINRKKIIVIGYWLLIIGLLIYTRFLNLGWGLPYPFHPDERNMAMAVQQMRCDFSIKECFNPHFFAYGQFPLYLGFLGGWIIKFYKGDWLAPMSFEEAVLSLRMISALASVLTVFVCLKILKRLGKLKNIVDYSLLIILFTFSPFLIQFSHFGTTESLLILFYLLIIYYSLELIQNKKLNIKYYLLTAFFSGLALATKISSLIFIALPLLALFIRLSYDGYKKFISWAGGLVILSLLVGIVFSPHNLISFSDFLGALNYESSVALGKIKVFYTRQFEDASPVIFYLTKVFPYALGWPVFILGILGGLGLDWKNKNINLLRLAFIIYFIPNAFLFVKWTRFMAPIFPIILILAILFLLKIKVMRMIKIIIFIVSILPGIAYLSIYQNPDIRFQASKWIFKNIPEGSLILSETANVVDLPIKEKEEDVVRNYNYISFNFYELDNNSQLKEQLDYYLQKANYIFVPSRRIFMNHKKEKYPLLAAYYQKLFYGELGFKEAARFASYPALKFNILNFKFKMEFPDEEAEETWTVFDHPVIRIYKKI